MNNDKPKVIYFFEVYLDEANKWRWRKKSIRGGLIKSCSGEAFDNKGNTIRAVRKEQEDMRSLSYITILTEAPYKPTKIDFGQDD